MKIIPLIFITLLGCQSFLEKTNVDFKYNNNAKLITDRVDTFVKWTENEKKSISSSIAKEKDEKSEKDSDKKTIEYSFYEFITISTKQIRLDIKVEIVSAWGRTSYKVKITKREFSPSTKDDRQEEFETKVRNKEEFQDYIKQILEKF